MGTKPKFTPRDLRRYENLGRGLGVFESYVPWHRISRSDPSSMGRSHLQSWRGRHRELLSDQELVAFLFSTMHPDVVDIREQFPLSLHSYRHELNDYRVGSVIGAFPGTLELADRLKTKHPMCRGNDEIAPWIMSTDLLLTLRMREGLQLLAISVKPSNVWIDKRTTALLGLEREYWAARNVPWLLVTDALYDGLVADLLKGASHWAFEAGSSPMLVHWLSQQAHELNLKTLTYALRRTAQYCGCPEKAKFAFWDAVWTGKLTIDLRRSWRPSSPITFLTEQDFWEINPIVARRSAWPA